MNMPSLKDILPHERQSVILQRLGSQGRVIATELAKEMSVSEDSIRRDLRELAQQGLCRRVYGGALSIAPDPGALSERIERNTPALTQLAEAAAALVKQGQTVFLDAGSTNQAIALALSPQLDLTVITNAPAIGEVLLSKPGIETILIGGRLDPKVGGSLGAKALREIQAIHADLYFMGACALSIETGVTAFHYEEAELKRALVASSATTVVALSAAKFDTLAPYQVVASNTIDHLVIETNNAIEPRLKAFRKLGCSVHSVNVQETLCTSHT
ncbi:DeoR/GlpR family DNA-binding transcription regulator [Pseudomonas asuensis]|uniref:DeoR family transcriptional regulator n=2 Tax=Pseudomonas asuensis TaxID=1825787 RepID=A0ABQ2GZ14_9PSED|nr:DeoR family transcriptional regulator [Pseudomonas asuensis]